MITKYLLASKISVRKNFQYSVEYGYRGKNRKLDVEFDPWHINSSNTKLYQIKNLSSWESLKFFIFRAMTNWSASREESAATWVFVMLDKNKDKVLERREWKSFHHLISSVEELKRCGRKLPRYCDVNHDVKISITEWLACLDVVMASTTTPSKYEINLKYFKLN